MSRESLPCIHDGGSDDGCLQRPAGVCACEGNSDRLPAATVPAPKSTVSVPMTQPDGLGRQPSADTPAQRVVSLAPSNTEILFALGAGAQLIGRDSFSDYPAEAKKVPDIGGGFTALNTELHSLSKPDLVLAAPLTPPEQIADLQNIGLTVFVVPNPKTFDDLYANLQTVAGTDRP